MPPQCGRDGRCRAPACTGSGAASDQPWVSRADKYVLAILSAIILGLSQASSWWDRVTSANKGGPGPAADEVTVPEGYEFGPVQGGASTPAGPSGSVARPTVAHGHGRDTVCGGSVPYQAEPPGSYPVPGGLPTPRGRGSGPPLPAVEPVNSAGVVLDKTDRWPTHQNNPVVSDIGACSKQRQRRSLNPRRRGGWRGASQQHGQKKNAVDGAISGTAGDSFRAAAPVGDAWFRARSGKIREPSKATHSCGALGMTEMSLQLNRLKPHCGPQVVGAQRATELMLDETSGSNRTPGCTPALRGGRDSCMGALQQDLAYLDPLAIGWTRVTRLLPQCECKS